jgi:hypothetical protein
MSDRGGAVLDRQGKLVAQSPPADDCALLIP